MFIYSIKSNGPNIDPCGTPQVTCTVHNNYHLLSAVLDYLPLSQGFEAIWILLHLKVCSFNGAIELCCIAALHPPAQKLRCYCIAVSHES